MCLFIYASWMFLVFFKKSFNAKTFLVAALKHSPSKRKSLSRPLRPHDELDTNSKFISIHKTLLLSSFTAFWSLIVRLFTLVYCINSCGVGLLSSCCAGADEL